MPLTPEGKALPALPGSRREASAIASLWKGRNVKVMVGAGAKEQLVRNQMKDGTVLHFATHGIVRDDMPFDSYLALGASGAGEAGDGRLTAGELYELDLNADLIVLSACRSGLGKVSMDGIVGLTRAFFYAGAASIMSTVWDVADEPTSRLMSGFYRAYGRTGDKSGALRTAQIQLLRALRAGQVKVVTPLGEAVLPEHPLFWAGVTLAGEP
jgi:CHAT domain-containing protein